MFCFIEQVLLKLKGWESLRCSICQELTRLLEAVKVGGGVILGESSIWLSVLWKLNIGMLARHHSDRLVPELHLVQMSHGLKRIETND